MTDRLVWIDCEMTGLDLARDALIEIACLVTDGNLSVLDEGVDCVIKPPADAVDGMLPVVRDMHTTSGLINELGSGVTLAEAQEQVLRYVRSHIPDSKKVPLCGNSIATDRSFLARDMPELDAFLHYRMVDVSSIKELARRWFPRAYFASPEKHGGHRALADIRESIHELQYYREAIFVRPPGPDSVTAREIASRHGGAEPVASAKPSGQAAQSAGAGSQAAPSAGAGSQAAPSAGAGSQAAPSAGGTAGGAGGTSGSESGSAR